MFLTEQWRRGHGPVFKAFANWYNSVQVIKLGSRAVPLLMALVVALAAQCASFCAISSCHASEASSSPPSHTAHHESPSGDEHHSHSSDSDGHEGGCGHSTCGDHSSYLVKSDSVSPTSEWIELLAIADSQFLPPDFSAMSAKVPDSAHSPPGVPDVGAFAQILRI